MNRFTKEELYTIISGLNAMDSSTDCGLYDCLIKKVASMIEHYCPHPSAIRNFGIVQHCADCKELVGGEISNDGTVGYTIPKYEYAREGEVVTYKLKGIK